MVASVIMCGDISHYVWCHLSLSCGDDCHYVWCYLPLCVVSWIIIMWWHLLLLCGNICHYCVVPSVIIVWWYLSLLCGDIYHYHVVASIIIMWCHRSSSCVSPNSTHARVSPQIYVLCVLLELLWVLFLHSTSLDTAAHLRLSVSASCTYHLSGHHDVLQCFSAQCITTHIFV